MPEEWFFKYIQSDSNFLVIFTLLEDKLVLMWMNFWSQFQFSEAGPQGRQKIIYKSTELDLKPGSVIY